MSVHVVTIQDGCKHMRPVLNREEYLRLRNSSANRKADKPHMVQMNYSCLPSADGLLRSAQRITTTVGMDIDLDDVRCTMNDVRCESSEKDVRCTMNDGRLPAANAECKVQNAELQSSDNKHEDIVRKILAKKEELGLLMLERSATKGFHIVFRRHIEKSQEDNLRWASQLLGVPYDKNAKDITRVFFTPADKLLYLDDAIFKIEEAPFVPDPAQPAPFPTTPTTSQPTAEEAAETASSASLHAFNLCVQNAGLSPDSMDVWGEHNWHANLMAVLSVGLPKLMSKAQLWAVVRDKLPNYSRTEDCRKLIAYFYDHYTADKGFMNVSLRDINAKAQQMAASEDAGSKEDDDQALDELTAGWQAPKLPRKIPRLMNLLVNNYDSRFREMLLLSALPELSAHASHYRARYLNGRIIGPQQHVAVIGGSGQGKGNCTQLFQDICQYTLQESDNQEWEKVRRNTELRDRKANAKDRPPKYHPKIHLFENASKTSILELMTNLGRNGMLLGLFSEVDGLFNATRSSYSDISVILRKGWDGDIHRQFYMSDATCNTYVQLNVSVLMEGTVKAMLERMFSDNNCEGGLMQRCIPVLVPKTRRTFRPPRQDYLTEDEKRERDALLIELYQKDLALGDETELLETPLMNKAIGQWFDQLEERYNDGLLTDAEADLSHRCGEFMLRAAIPLIALYGKETKDIVDFCRWVGESAHYTMCRIFGYRVQKDLQTANEMLSARLDYRCTIEPLLAQLPQVFTVKQLQEQRIKNGQSQDVRMLLSRYCRNGKIQRMGKGVYRKLVPEECNIVTVTKMSDLPVTDGNEDDNDDKPPKPVDHEDSD